MTGFNICILLLTSILVGIDIAPHDIMWLSYVQLNNNDLRAEEVVVQFMLMANKWKYNVDDGIFEVSTKYKWKTVVKCC